MNSPASPPPPPMVALVGDAHAPGKTRVARARNTIRTSASGHSACSNRRPSESGGCASTATGAAIVSATDGPPRVRGHGLAAAARRTPDVLLGLSRPQDRCSPLAPATRPSTHRARSRPPASFYTGLDERSVMVGQESWPPSRWRSTALRSLARMPGCLRTCAGPAGRAAPWPWPTPGVGCAPPPVSRMRKEPRGGRQGCVKGPSRARSTGVHRPEEATGDGRPFELGTSMMSVGARRLPTVLVSGRSQRDLDTYLRGHATSLREVAVVALAACELNLASLRSGWLGGVDEVRVLNDAQGLPWSLAQLVALATLAGTRMRWRRPPVHRCPACRGYAVVIVRCPDELAVCLSPGCGWSGSDLQAINQPAAPVPLLDEPKPKRSRLLRVHAHRG